MGIGQATQGIEARRQDEADVLLCQPVGIEFGHLHDHLQPQPLGMTQSLKSSLQQVTDISGLHRHVGHDPQGQQVEILGRSLRPSRSLVQRFRQLVSASHSWQFAQRMCARKHLGVHHRLGCG